VTLQIPDNALRALGAGAEAEIRLAAALKLYEQRRLSAGQAAELAGISKVACISKLGEHGIPAFDMIADELERDAAAARRASSR
jgi:predicted HTH domain antitoxin